MIVGQDCSFIIPDFTRGGNLLQKKFNGIVLSSSASMIQAMSLKISAKERSVMMPAFARAGIAT